MVFEREDRKALEMRKETALQQRALGDLLMRYHYMLENTKVVKPMPVSDIVKTRVSYRVMSVNTWGGL